MTPRRAALLIVNVALATLFALLWHVEQPQYDAKPTELVPVSRPVDQVAERGTQTISVSAPPLFRLARRASVVVPEDPDRPPRGGPSAKLVQGRSLLHD